MPTFDVVCKVNLQEVRNAVDQATREIANRYDLKDTNTKIELNTDNHIALECDTEFTMNAVTDIVVGKLVKRNVDPLFFKQEAIEPAAGGRVKRLLSLQDGISQEVAKNIVKLIKETKIKVQTQIRGDELRFSGKNRDDLQEAIQFLKSKTFDRPLSFINFRD